MKGQIENKSRNQSATVGDIEDAFKDHDLKIQEHLAPIVDTIATQDAAIIEVSNRIAALEIALGMKGGSTDGQT